PLIPLPSPTTTSPVATPTRVCRDTGALSAADRMSYRLPHSASPAAFYRTWTRQAPGSGKRKSWWTADATDAQKDRRRRLRNALPIEKASGGAGVRTDQTGTRLPPVPVARRQESTCRVGHDLHHPQSPETFHPRKGRLRRLPCNKCPAAMPIWTGYEGERKE